MDKIHFTTTTIKLKDIKKFNKNPRKISGKNKSILIDSLKEFGQVDLIVIDYDNTLISGHQRLSILIQLYGGDYQVEARKPNRKLTEKEFHKYNLLANKPSGTFDFEKLNMNFDYDLLKSVGFDDKELTITITKDNDDVEIDKMDLSGFESYDYLMFIFNNTFDYNYVTELFNIQKVDYGYDDIKKIGFGRVIKGKELIKKLKK